MEPIHRRQQCSMPLVQRARARWLSMLSVLALLVGQAVMGCDSELGMLEGQVLDLLARPVDARVSISGQALETRTSGEGAYRLPFVPGRFEVVYEAPGFQSSRRSWDLYASARVRALPVTLVPLPPGPGLWTSGEAGLEAIPSVSPREVGAPELGAHKLGAPKLGAPDLGAPELGAPDLGGLSLTRRSSYLRGPARAWCLDTPLLFLSSDPAIRPPIRAQQVGPDGHLWTEGLTPVEEPSAGVVVETLGEGLWTLTPRAPGRVALVTEPLGALGRRWLYDLAVTECREADASGATLPAPGAGRRQEPAQLGGQP